MKITLDITTARAANLSEQDNGKWIVWQDDPGVCLGIGDTRDAAIDDAVECGCDRETVEDGVEIGVLEIEG
jgi:hypothetical protein